MAAASATSQPPIRHTYGINFTILHCLILENHKIFRKFDLKVPRTRGHCNLNTSEIFSRQTYSINFKILHCLVLDLQHSQ